MKFILLVACVIAIISVLILIFHRTESWFVDIKIKNQTIRAEVADTMVKRAQGLSGYAPLEPDEGMYFIFDTPGNYGFWMHGMKFPIDIIWINGTTVVGFQENAPIPTGLNIPIYYPPSAIDRVLEVNAGTVQKFGIQTGEMIQLIQ